MIYNIDYSDVLKPTFTIPENSYNGPGGTNVDSSLRLYGQSTLLWGESVNENLLRLSENFASATPPIAALPGQLWLKQELYWRNTSVAISGGTSAPNNAFFRYDLTTRIWNTRDSTNGFNVRVVNNLPAGGSSGEYVYNLADGTLYRWDSQYRQATAGWLSRATTLSNGVPGNATPRETLHVFNMLGLWDGVGGGSGGATIGRIDKTSTARTLVAADVGGLVRYDSPVRGEFIVPHNSTVPIIVGAEIRMRQVDIGKITLAPASGVTLNMGVGTNTPTTLGMGSNVSLIKVDINEWDVTGDFPYE